MDLKNASIDDISLELSRREQPFFLILAKPDNPESQFHCYSIPPKVAISLLEDGAKVMRSIVDDGKIPANCRILKNVTRDGKLLEQVEVTDVDEVFDPWQPRNAIGEFNPWKEADEVDGEKKEEIKEEIKDVEPEAEPEDGFDPWSNKDAI